MQQRQKIKTLKLYRPPRFLFLSVLLSFLPRTTTAAQYLCASWTKPPGLTSDSDLSRSIWIFISVSQVSHFSLLFTSGSLFCLNLLTPLTLWSLSHWPWWSQPWPYHHDFFCFLVSQRTWNKKFNSHQEFSECFLFCSWVRIQVSPVMI